PPPPAAAASACEGARPRAANEAEPRARPPASEDHAECLNQGHLTPHPSLVYVLLGKATLLGVTELAFGLAGGWQVPGVNTPHVCTFSRLSAMRQPAGGPGAEHTNLKDRLVGRYKSRLVERPAGSLSVGQAGFRVRVSRHESSAFVLAALGEQVADVLADSLGPPLIRCGHEGAPRPACVG